MARQAALAERAVVLAHDLAARGGAERVAVAAATAFRDAGARVVLATLGSPCSASEIEQYFDVDLAGIRLMSLKPDRTRHRLPAAIARIAGLHTVARKLRALRADVFVNCAFRSELPGVARRNLYYVHFPHDLRIPVRGVAHGAYLAAMRLLQVVVANRCRAFLASYDVILANSRFTAGQVARSWGREAEVLYPPCDRIEPGTDARQPVILSVGRFQDREPGRPHKRQDALIGAFAEMTDLHAAGWSLHLAGSIGSASELARLRGLAAGLPVAFHPDASKAELEDLYRTSSLYWHGQGFGEPAPVAQEHFGISVVEAMSAGLIPLVYGTAGPREIVEPVDPTLLWVNRDELIAATRALFLKPMTDRGMLRDEVRSRAVDFSQEMFRRRLQVVAVSCEGKPDKNSDHAATPAPSPYATGAPRA